MQGCHEICVFVAEQFLEKVSSSCLSDPLFFSFFLKPCEPSFNLVMLNFISTCLLLNIIKNKTHF